MSLYLGLAAQCPFSGVIFLFNPEVILHESLLMLIKYSELCKQDKQNDCQSNWYNQKNIGIVG